MRLDIAALAAALIITPAIFKPALAGSTPAPEGAKVYFISPENGASLQSPVLVQFGLSGMGVAPAGTEKENTGHHHLLINTPMLEGEDLDFSITDDENHRHFGGGQTEVKLELSPGEHTLQLLLGDKDHIPHDPPIASEVITITVVE